jgi:beta-carotene 3-hydroxylase
MLYFLLALTVLFGFLFMEFAAWFTHKYVMHGFLWVLHKDHHSPKKKLFERNDIFAVIFAIPSFLLIYFGLLLGNTFMVALGAGIALYGLAYFLFHDVFYHRRIIMFGKAKSWYFKAIVRAHDDHHKGKKNYGFLFMVPISYLKEEYDKKNN